MNCIYIDLESEYCTLLQAHCKYMSKKYCCKYYEEM